MRLVIEVDNLSPGFYRAMQAEHERATGLLGSFGEGAMSLQTPNRDVNASIIGILTDDGQVIPLNEWEES